VPKSQRAAWDGKAWFPLGKTEAEAYRVWLERMGDATNRRVTTMSQLFDRYCLEVLPNKSPRTQRGYFDAIKRLRLVFGEMEPGAIRPTDVYGFMDRRPAVAGNRDVATLSDVFNSAIRWGLVDANPCRQVKRSTERPRDRLIRADELAAFMTDAPELLRAYVALKLLAPARQGQLLRLRLSDWDESAAVLRVDAAKGGRTTEYQGEALRVAVKRALALRAKAKVRSMYIFGTRSGTKYTEDGFRSIWQRQMVKFVEAGGERFTEHDLRAMVASGLEPQQAQKLLGHTDARVTQRVYQRGPVRVEV
jgi:integrase